MHKVLAYLLIFLLLYPASLPAQTTNGSVIGRVMDPSKASVPDANATNGAREYTLANLPPATYQLEVGKPGLKKLVRPDVTLHVQDALAIDFEMVLGGATETVMLQGGAPLMNSESATVSTLVDDTIVEDMPRNARSFQTLIMLTPVVMVTQTAFDDWTSST